MKFCLFGLISHLLATKDSHVLIVHGHSQILNSVRLLRIFRSKCYEIFPSDVIHLAALKVKPGSCFPPPGVNSINPMRCVCCLSLEIVMNDYH